MNPKNGESLIGELGGFWKKAAVSATRRVIITV